MARELHELGFRLVCTRGTAELVAQAGIPVEVVNKVKEGRPHIVDMIKNGQIDLIVNTTEDARRSPIRLPSGPVPRARVYYTTTLAGGRAVCMALRHGPATAVRSLQELHAGVSL